MRYLISTHTHTHTLIYYFIKSFGRDPSPMFEACKWRVIDIGWNVGECIGASFEA